MATPPANAKAPRASSILSQAQTATTNLKPVPAGAPTSVTTKAWVTLRRVMFSIEDVGSKQLYDILNRMQESVLGVLGVVTTNQLIPGNILRAVPMTAGGNYYLAHGLGRPWQGYFIVRQYQGAAANGLVDIPYTTGLAADTILPVSSAATGTYDIYVF